MRWLPARVILLVRVFRETLGILLGNHQEEQDRPGSVRLHPPSSAIGKLNVDPLEPMATSQQCPSWRPAKGTVCAAHPVPCADAEVVHQWIWGKNGSSSRIVMLTKALRWLSTVHSRTPAIIHLHLPASPKASMGKGGGLGLGWVPLSNWACVEKGIVLPQVDDHCRWKENANPETRSSG